MHDLAECVDGQDTFLVSAYSAKDAAGSLLSCATVSATIAGNGTRRAGGAERQRRAALGHSRSDAALNVFYVVSTAGTQTRTVAITPPPQNGGPVRSAFATDGSLCFTLQLSVVRVTLSSGAATEFNQFPAR